MDVYSCSRTKYDIPLNHLDFNYISSCNNKQELEKIVKILRSGEEGTYPDLEICAEKKLASLDPQNKLLRKPDTLKTARDLDKEEWKQIDDDLKNWMSDVKSAEQSLNDINLAPSSDAGDNLPPVRGTATAAKCNKDGSSCNSSSSKRAPKTVKPRDYREWDKFDIEAELKRADEKKEVAQEKNPKKPAVSESVDNSGLNDQLRQMKAEREKEKGNEAFRAGDFEEALLYYSRSISLLETVAARNNRAQTYLKLKNWNKALDDCEEVLRVEPTNLKATLRRAVANQGLTRYVEARKDLEAVLAKEPNNKQAMEVLKSVNKAMGEPKTTGRRIVIEEVEESDEEPQTVSTAKDNKLFNNVAPAETAASDEQKLQKNVTDTAESNEHKAEPVVHTVTEMSGDGAMEKEETSKQDQSESTVNSSAGEGGNTLHHIPSVSSEIQLAALAESLPPAVQTLKDAGNDLFRKGQYSDALEKYNAAIQLMLDGGSGDDVGLSPLYSNRAACLMKVGDCQSCINDCNSALALYPGSSKPLLRRAMAYEALEKYRQAFVDYRQVLQMGSNVEVAQQGSDRCSSVLQKLDGPQWRDKLPSVPSNSNLVSLAAAAAPASPQINTTVSNESMYETCKTEGNSLFAKGEYAKAVDLFTKCVELFPERVVPYTNRALCYLRLNQFDDVLNDCNQALSLEFHNVKALFRRAQAYKMQHRYEESMIDLETLLKIDPSNSAARKELDVVMKSKEEEREKRLEACFRKHRQRVHIEEVDNSSDEEHKETAAPLSRGKKTRHQATAHTDAATTKSPAAEAVKHAKQKCSSAATDSASTPPMCRAATNKQNPTKMTPFEFMQAWNGLKGTTDIEAFVNILDCLRPADLPKVITNKLDSDFLIKVVRCVKQLAARGDAAKGFEFLHWMASVPRFDTIIMFLSDTEKKEVSAVFELLSSSASPSVVETPLFTCTRNKYIL